MQNIILNENETSVYLAISNQLERPNRFQQISDEKIIEESGIEPDGLIPIIKKLVLNGFIQKENGCYRVE
ncbi:hypothetical protein [Formosa sp. L2A11]|uniref:hypothetical protein n=1 Tax=Formosa sp. L2A11 TaxID=2686363 RepID=UPI00131D5795|nr:hypothetical protein [Formosa sp. L2A11]